MCSFTHYGKGIHMRSGKSSTGTVRSRNGKSLLRPSSQVRRRRSWLNLESLEERTLLSTLASDASAALALNQIGATATTVGQPSANSSNLPGTSVVTTVPQGASDEASALATSVQDAHTIATVVDPLTTDPHSLSSTGTSNAHIYTGQPSNFVGPNPTTPPTGGTGSTSNPGQYNPNQPSLAALAAMAKSIDAQPQYLLMPSDGQRVSDSGEGPAGGYTPLQIQGAYGISDGNAYNDNITFGGIKGDGAGQTIAVVDAGDNPGFVSTSDPNFDASALHVFDQEFGLPDPPSFQKYDEFGNVGGTGTEVPGWSIEIALDVEWAHAMAPGANIILMEGYSSSLSDLLTANVTAATQLGASVISNSWGYPLEVEGDGSEEPFLDEQYLAPAYAANPYLTILASSGDDGSFDAPIYPSASPLVVSAGGTSLETNGTTWTGEFSWNAGGGGISSIYSAPAYQQGVTGFSTRTNPDISSDANLETGVSVYDPEYGGWVLVGGTSVSSPTLAGMIGIADQGRVQLGGQPLNGPNQTLPGLYSDIDYNNTYHDITEDFNGEGNNGFPTGPGYDLDTGIGSPRARI